MITAAQLGINVVANTAQAQAGLSALGVQVKSTQGGLSMLSKIGIVSGLAIAGIGIASIKMAGDFQNGITTLVTGAGETRANMKMIGDGILQLATDTGTSTQQLISGMYMIESAGFHGATALDVLRAAAEGAKVGNADLGAVANGVTTIMVDYKDANISATEATNLLIATVANGKTHMQDLATAISGVLPAASAVHVHLLDVAAAMATMTGEGTDAAEASTYLRQLLLALSAPAKQGAKALEGIGLSSTEVAADMKKSLPDTLKLIMQHLAETYKVGSPQYIAALKAIAGGSRQMQGILELTGSHLKTLNDNMTAIQGASMKGQKGISGWNLVQQDFNFKLARAREVVETFMIRLGTGLLPVAGKVVDLFSKYFVPTLMAIFNAIGRVIGAGASFVSWLHGTGPAATAVKVILAILGGAMLGLAASSIPAAITAISASVTAFGAQASAAAAAAAATLAAAAPFILIGAAIGGVIAIIVLLVTHWKQFTDAIKIGWHIVSSTFMEGVRLVGNALGVVLTPIKGFLNLLGQVKDFVVGSFVNGFKAMTGIVSSVFSGLFGIVKGPINGILTGVNWLIGALDSIHVTIPSWVPFVGGDSFGISIPKIPLLAKGGDVDPNKPYVVGDGGGPELFIPNRRGTVVSNNVVRHAMQSSAASAMHGFSGGGSNGGSGGDRTIVVQIGTQQLMRIVLPAMARAVRTQAAVRHM